MKRYKHIFFDLDHTLWDFEKNSQETIEELFEEFQLHTYLPSAIEMYFVFKKVNRLLWDKHHMNLIGKEELRKRRFEMVFEHFELSNDKLAERFSDSYIKICPSKPYLLPNAMDILEYLKDKYTLHIMSNGFDEITKQKLEGTLIKSYFQTIITPTVSGFKKPESEMFQFALTHGRCSCKEAIMIGDDLEADIIGAKKCHIDQIFFNPENITHHYTITYEIKELTEIKNIL